MATTFYSTYTWRTNAYISSDEPLGNQLAVYQTLHDAVSVSGYQDSDASTVGQAYFHIGIEGYPFVWNIRRLFLYFDTSAIPDGAEIISAKLRFYCQASPDVAFDIVIQNGQPTYPHNPGEDGDYNYANYSGNGGSINTNDLTFPDETFNTGWNEIDLNDDGKSWINKGGLTKLAIRSSRDISSTPPATPSGASADIQNYVRIQVGSYWDGTRYVQLVVTYTTVGITTQAVTQITDYACAMGNGTIVAGEPTERGFEIKTELLSYFGVGGDIWWGMIGFNDDSLMQYGVPTAGNRMGYLVKTETWTGEFSPGVYEGVLGYEGIAYLIFGNPDHIFNDALEPGYAYKCRAYMVIDDTYYYGAWVDFDTIAPDGVYPPTDDISEGNPVVPIIPIEPGIEWEFPEFIWEFPEFEFPPWVLPDLPSWEFPDYPPMSFVGDFYYRKPYTKKDLDDLRKKCIIYNKNSVEFALVLRHNMNVLREFFNMMTDYLGKDEFNDFTDLIPPQRLKELYLDPLELNDFRDMINEFIRNTIDNNMAVNRNFKLINEATTDPQENPEEGYFREINSNIKTVTEDSPDVHRLKRKIDSLNQEVSMNFSSIMRNLKVLRARLL